MLMLCSYPFLGKYMMHELRKLPRAIRSSSTPVLARLCFSHDNRKVKKNRAKYNQRGFLM